MDITKIIILVLLFLIVSLYGYDFYQQCYIDLEQEYYIFMNYSDKHCHLELAKKYHYGSDKIKINYPKAMELYTIATQNKDYVAFIYQAQLYSDMLNIEKSIEYYNKAIEKGYFQCFINLGDIYFYEKDYVDIELAELNYEAAFKHSTFSDAKIQAMDKLKTIRLEKSDDFYHTEYNDIDIFNTIINEEKPVPGLRELMNKTENKNYIKLEVNKNDRQNVHDHVVSNTVKKSIENIQKYTKIITNKPQSLIDLRNFIKNKKNHQNIALKVLDHIETDPVKYRDSDLLEVDVLYLVWNRIHNECNKEKINELKDNLYNRLLECNENDVKVCASGIFSRIIDTLNYCDSENIVEIIPKYVLNKELMEKSIKISNDFKKEQPEDLQNILKKVALSEEETKKTNEYMERFKLKLISEFRKDYIDSNIITEDILFLEINKWIDYL
jgi:hypothetical protein